MRRQEEDLPEDRAVDVSSLRTAGSGECVDTAPSSAVRCTISILRRELGRTVFRAHVVNDTEQIVRCTPGVKRETRAWLQRDVELLCEPHAEMGFLFALPRLGRGGRSAFVRVAGTTFACGFELPIDRDAAAAALLSIGVATLLVAIVAGAVVYERRRSRYRRASEPRPPAIYEPPAAPPAHIVTVAPPAPTIPDAAHGIEARGFAAVLDEQRVVMGAIECTGQRFLSSDFVAKVVNQTGEPVRCAVVARTRAGRISVVPGTFTIHPHSAAAVAVPAPLRFPWRLRALELSMESGTLRASAQADVPVPLGVKIALGIAAAAMATMLALFAYRVARPSIQGFAVPATILAGDPATASYAIGGVGRGRYDVVFEGTRVAGGSVSGNGSFTFATSARPGTYVVTLRARGLLGTAQETLALRALRTFVPPAATIASLAVDPGVAPAGAPLTVRYSANGDAGTVTLLDAAGITLERVPYRRDGFVELHAPPATAPTQLVVALDVTRASATARASVGLLVLPRALPTPRASVAPPAGPASVSALLRLPAHAVSAHGFEVGVLEHPQNLVVSLQDPRGAVLASQSVAAGQARVRFLAPRVANDARYFIVARFASGTADSVLLDPLTIYSRPRR